MCQRRFSRPQYRCPHQKATERRHTMERAHGRNAGTRSGILMKAATRSPVPWDAKSSIASALPLRRAIDLPSVPLETSWVKHHTAWERKRLCAWVANVVEGIVLVFTYHYAELLTNNPGPCSSRWRSNLTSIIVPLVEDLPAECLSCSCCCRSGTSLPRR